MNFLLSAEEKELLARVQKLAHKITTSFDNAETGHPNKETMNRLKQSIASCAKKTDYSFCLGICYDGKSGVLNRWIQLNGPDFVRLRVLYRSSDPKLTQQVEQKLYKWALGNEDYWDRVRLDSHSKSNFKTCSQSLALSYVVYCLYFL